MTFGTWGIGGSAEKSPAYGPSNFNFGKNLVKKAIDIGINFFDTAPAYGNGTAESILGNFSCNEKIFISTKIGRTNLTDPPNWSKQFLLESLNNSLKNLKRDYVDVLLLHSPNINSESEFDEAVETLWEQKTMDKIKYLGVALQKPSDWVSFRKFDLNVVQVNFNLLDLRAIAFFDEWQKRGIGIMARGPFASGLISQNTFEFESKNDHRSRWPQSLISKLKFMKLSIQKEFKINDSEILSLALQFVNSFEQVSTIVSTMNTPEEIEFNCSQIYKENENLREREKLIQLIQSLD